MAYEISEIQHFSNDETYYKTLPFKRTVECEERNEVGINLIQRSKELQYQQC
ncbi:MAG: hypothetical protein ACLTK8_00840 [Paeniclostridium sp.]